MNAQNIAVERQDIDLETASPQLSIVLPIYNEAESLPHLLDELVPVLDQMGYSFEIIGVDDGSRDGSFAELEKLRAQDKRVRAVHTEDPDLVGGTAYLIRRDPFLAYQLGRNLNFRQFRVRDGVFGPMISGLGGPIPDGATARNTLNDQVSECNQLERTP